MRMRENEFLALHGPHVVLLPYRAECVVKYHGWMESETLRAETCSERLTLEEEFEMQAEWLRDPLKCTFLIYDRAELEAAGNLDKGVHMDSAMVGDINLFFACKEDDPTARSAEAEVSVMIAENGVRRRGFASEAVQLMLRFARDELGCREVQAKIVGGNEASLGLFRKLGFGDERHIEAFDETHLCLDLAGDVGSAAVAVVSDTYLHALDRE